MENGENTRVNAHQPASEPRQNPHGFWRGVREWIQIIVIALIISLPIRFFVAEPFVVNGASMDPTFSTGQFLIVDRLTYRFNEPKRGDVVVFKYPNNPKVYYIKRVIGLPDETIKIKDGEVTIINAEHPSGLELEESYVRPVHMSKETLSATLKQGEYFVMGDNRAESSDSRIWGALDQSLILGRPVVRLLPISALSFFPGQYHE